jgi:integrase
MGKLTALGIAKLTEEGMHLDGDGLYLQVGKGGARSWIYRYQSNKKPRYLGLGSASVIALKEARERAAAARLQRARGIDPIEASRQPKAPSGKTFRQVAEDFITTHEAGWTPKHAKEWTATLETYAYPHLGDMPVRDVDLAAVLSVLQPIWVAKSVTARRVRSRLELVLDATAVHGLRDAVNPAQWRGRLDKVLQAPSKIHRVTHLDAMPFAEIPQFMARLRTQPSMGARALEFTILTAVRTNESLGGRPDEIVDDVWTIPAERMKARKEHRVPLVGRALEIAQACRTPYLFRGRYEGDALNSTAMMRQLRRLKMPYAVHGFRSTFKDWAEETTSHPNVVIEMALAHTVGNAVENAYRRGDLLLKRRELMTAWDAYCCP